MGKKKKRQLQLFMVFRRKRARKTIERNYVTLFWNSDDVWEPVGVVTARSPQEARREALQQYPRLLSTTDPDTGITSTRRMRFQPMWTRDTSRLKYQKVGD